MYQDTNKNSQSNDNNNKFNNTYFYIPKESIYNLCILNDGENAILKDFGNGLGITCYFKDNQYLFKISYITEDKAKFKFKYNFTI